MSLLSTLSTPATAEAAWERLDKKVRNQVRKAEKAGVKLAMHPDDPPLSPIRGSMLW